MPSRVAEEEVKGKDDSESRVSLLRPEASEAECLLDSLEEGGGGSVAVQCRSTQLSKAADTLMCVTYRGSGSDINAAW